MTTSSFPILQYCNAVTGMHAPHFIFLFYFNYYIRYLQKNVQSISVWFQEFLKVNIFIKPALRLKSNKTLQSSREHFMPCPGY